MSIQNSTQSLNQSQNQDNTIQNLTLEQKLTRLKEIYETIEQEKPNLSQSVILLEEAHRLKELIENELKEIENRIIKLNSQD
jgi:exonuclease VII small subunit